MEGKDLGTIGRCGVCLGASFVWEVGVFATKAGFGLHEMGKSIVDFQ